MIPRAITAPFDDEGASFVLWPLFVLFPAAPLLLLLLAVVVRVDDVVADVDGALVNEVEVDVDVDVDVEVVGGAVKEVVCSTFASTTVPMSAGGTLNMDAVSVIHEALLLELGLSVSRTVA